MNNHQEMVLQLLRKLGYNHSLEARLLDLISELGEFSKEILKSTSYGTNPVEINSELIEEFGDMYFSFITIANRLNISLDNLIEQTIKKYQSRLETNSSIGSS